MRRSALLIATVLAPLLLTACLWLPEEKSVETNVSGADAPVTTSVTGEDVESGTESPAATAVENTDETVTENVDTTQTPAGCPEIPDANPTLETPIPYTSAAALVGLTEKVATACAENEGWGVRIIAKDGEEYMVTADYRSDRVNLTIVNDAVTAVNVG
jgi:hypothetical protein